MKKSNKALVSYVIKSNQQLKKRIKALEKIVSEMGNVKDNLTVKEVCEIYPISERTFYRYRDAGMKVSQPKRNGKIIVNRKEFEKYLNQ